MSISKNMTIKIDTYIKLTQLEVKKLGYCNRDIDDGEYSNHELITGLIDGGYANALASLYKRGRIGIEEVYQGIDELPDYFQEDVRRRIT